MPREFNEKESVSHENKKRKVTGYLDNTDAINFTLFKTKYRIKPDTLALEILLRIGIKHQKDYSF